MSPQRRRLIAGGMGLFGAHRLGHGQPAGAMRRVGILALAPEAAGAHVWAAFKQGMHDLGWVEGKNVEYRIVSAEGDVNRMDTLARDLIARKVDLIVVGSAIPARAAQRATKTIPIVMTGVGDPVSEGFVASLAKPGGNITGISNQAAELLAKQIQILHEVVPAAQRMAILLNEGNPKGAALYRAAAQGACIALSVTPVWVVANAPAELAGAALQIVRRRSQAVAVVANPMYFSERIRLHELLRATQLPVAYGQPEHVVAGGLLSYASNYVANFRYAAKFVDKILKGARPAELPVEQSTRFELVINLKTAKLLGITVPQSLLVRADEVIE